MTDISRIIPNTTSNGTDAKPVTKLTMIISTENSPNDIAVKSTTACCIIVGG
eukprot:CAMPEP_0184700658 /NCGR_PEP_ID=MMETSP0313-20130426/15082_1 /TAXON_ID=2792 /ORGANISM="Porphyridium aerugineum, Strain SAG 1380-2" /LENGTH=51 /DNA_ID=CAMNT_0027160443 /DNA_START=634 /DNA_END=786 /DNA_ORIENTATION=+